MLVGATAEPRRNFLSLLPMCCFVSSSFVASVLFVLYLSSVLSFLGFLYLLTNFGRSLEYLDQSIGEDIM